MRRVSRKRRVTRRGRTMVSNPSHRTSTIKAIPHKDATIAKVPPPKSSSFPKCNAEIVICKLWSDSLSGMITWLGTTPSPHSASKVSAKAVIREGGFGSNNKRPSPYKQDKCVHEVIFCQKIAEKNF